MEFSGERSLNRPVVSDNTGFIQIFGNNVNLRVNPCVVTQFTRQLLSQTLWTLADRKLGS